jgi:hypothetical protein
MARAPGGILNCTEPSCEYIPPIIFFPLPTNEPASNPVVKPSRLVMAQQTMTETDRASFSERQNG